MYNILCAIATDVVNSSTSVALWTGGRVGTSVVPVDRWLGGDFSGPCRQVAGWGLQWSL